LMSSPTYFKDPNFVAKFDRRLHESVFGQHLATRSIISNFEEHLNLRSAQPLAISLLGSTGTGKTFMSGLMAQSWGVPLKLDFLGAMYDDENLVQEYRREIEAKIKENVRQCPQALFVFSDFHKMTPGVIDVVVPFLDYGAHNVNGVDYSKAVYIFHSNYCHKEINLMTRQDMKGKRREDVTGDGWDQMLRSCLERTPFGKTGLFEKALLTHIPFLPFTRSEVKQCVEAELAKIRTNNIGKFKTLTWDARAVHWMVERVNYVDEFAELGCRNLDKLIPTYLHLDKVSPRNRQCEAADGVPANQFCRKHALHALDISTRDGHLCITVVDPSWTVSGPCL